MEVLDVVRLVEVGQVCLEQLTPDERLVLDILADEGDEKMMRICEELEISRATAYRKKDVVLGKLSELFRDFGVRIS